jgi:DNA-binding MarR family transcriptional regulator
MANVTKLGAKQRSIILVIGRKGALTYLQLLRETKLDASQLSRLLRGLVDAKVLVHCWNKKGQAVYRLPEGDARR